MKISIITLFPNLFTEIFKTSIIGRASKLGLVEYQLINLRSFGEGPHQIVDDRPYGGGIGMVFKADILAKALKFAYSNRLVAESQKKSNQQSAISNQLVVLMSASGIPFKQTRAKKLSKLDHLIIICGHYEGIDQRFIDKYVDLEISIGDYVLTGGEIPAMVVIDTVVRLIPKVLKADATTYESFNDNLLEHPQYTRPDSFEGEKIPKVLISGNHQEIAKWRKEQALKKTKKIRPDLLK